MVPLIILVGKLVDKAVVIAFCEIINFVSTVLRSRVPVEVPELEIGECFICVPEEICAIGLKTKDVAVRPITRYVYFAT